MTPFVLVDFVLAFDGVGRNEIVRSQVRARTLIIDLEKVEKSSASHRVYIDAVLVEMIEQITADLDGRVWLMV